MTGYELMTQEQREDWDRLQEASTHRTTMRFTALDAAHLIEYEMLAARLEMEYQKEIVMEQVA